MKIKEICDYSGSTLLGMNGGMVESPDSKRIIYARKADLTKSETEIWICDRDFEIIARYMMYTAAITTARQQPL